MPSFFISFFSCYSSSNSMMLCVYGDKQQQYNSANNHIEIDLDGFQKKIPSLNARTEKSSLQFYLHKILSVLRSEGKEREVFIHNYIRASAYLFSKALPLNIIHLIIKVVSQYFDVQTCRIFIKHKETQRLILALFYDSWMPFIENTIFSKSEKTFRVKFDSITYKDKQNIVQQVNSPFDITYKIAEKRLIQNIPCVPIHDFTNCQKIESPPSSEMIQSSTNLDELFQFGINELRIQENPSKGGNLPSIINFFGNPEIDTFNIQHLIW